MVPSFDVLFYVGDPWILPLYLILPYAFFIASGYRGLIWVWEAGYAPFSIRLGLSIILAIVASVFTWKLHDIGAMIFKLACFLAMAHGGFLAMSERRHSLLILVFLLFVSGVFLAEKMKKILKLPYYESKRNWWESYPKAIPGLDVEILNENSEFVSGRLSNFGQDGCFVFLPNGEKIIEPKAIRLSSKDKVLFEAEVELVEQTKDKFGYGLKFLHQDSDGDWSKDLQDYLGFLRRAGYDVASRILFSGTLCFYFWLH